MSDVKVIPITDAYRDNWRKIDWGKKELEEGKARVEAYMEWERGRGDSGAAPVHALEVGFREEQRG